MDRTTYRPLTALVLGSALVACLGCTSLGTKVPQADLLTFQPGVATCTEVVARFGPPTSISVDSRTGAKQIFYRYVQTQVDPKAFIPFYGRAQTIEQTQAMIECDK